MTPAPDTPAPETPVPGRGELIWITFDPRLGHEQGGRRPALVISNGAYNGVTGLLLAMPITSRPKGYPSEIPLPAGSAVQGVILTSHVYTLDWQARGFTSIGMTLPDVLSAALQRLATIILQ